jgi:hypothetical protein
MSDTREPSKSGSELPPPPRGARQTVPRLRRHVPDEFNPGPRPRWWWFAVFVAVGVVAGGVLQFFDDAPQGEAATGTQQFQGEGVAIELPNNWEAAAEVEELPSPSGPDADAMADYLEDARTHNDEYLRLVGFEGFRAVAMYAFPANLAPPDMDAFVDRFVRDQERQDWVLVDRFSMTVDDNPATAVVLAHPSTNEQSLDVLWAEDGLAWLATWSTDTEDFAAAETVFRAAMATATTESLGS